MVASPFQYPIHYGTNIVGAGQDSTVSITSGSLLVVGTFTNFQSACQPGDLFLAGGYVNFVKSIEGPENLTLGLPWPGPTLTDAAFVVQRWMQHTDGRWIGTTITEYFAAVERIPVDIAADIALVTAARDATFGARDKAQQWATKTDGEVEAGLGFGAKKYAQDAAQTLTNVVAAGETAVTNVGTAQTAATGAINNIVAQGLIDVDAIRDDVTARQADVTAKQGTASTAATASAAARDTAQQWAENPEDDDVAAGQFSAKHYALKGAASATGAAGSATAASNTSLAFDKRFLGSKAADPALDNQGAALAIGALYWNTTIPGMRVYKGAAVWGDATANVTITRWKKASLAAATATLTGNDDVGLALNYISGLELVMLNGSVLVATVDYARTNANTITSLVGNFPAGATVEILQFSAFTVTDAPLKANNGSDFPNPATVRANIGIKPPTIQKFTANGTWNRPAGCTAIEVWVQAAGGGCPATPAAAASQMVLSGGGGGGGAGYKLILGPSVSETITVGVGAVAATGGSTSFGAIMTATGGGPGVGMGGSSPSYIVNGGGGGSCSGHDIIYNGGAGGAAIGFYPYGYGGLGGASLFSGGGQGAVNVIATGGATGVVAGYGSGAGGIVSSGYGAIIAGNAGAAGIVVVKEYYQ